MKHKDELFYFHVGIKLDSYETMLRIYKTKNFSFEKVYELAFSGNYKRTHPLFNELKDEFSESFYNEIKPFTQEELEKMFSPLTLEKLELIKNLRFADDDGNVAYEWNISRKVGGKEYKHVPNEKIN